MAVLEIPELEAQMAERSSRDQNAADQVNRAEHE